MSASRRLRGQRSWPLAVALATATATIFVLPGGSAGASPLTGSHLDAGDGDMAGSTDWMQLVSRSVPDTTATGVRLQAKVNDAYKGSSGQDSSFVNGTKEDDAPPSVGTGGIPPNKDDFTHLYVASEHVTGTTPKDFLYLGWTRTSNSGTAFESFEFNQNATLSTNGVTPVRVEGDLLVLYDLVNGGSTPVLHYSTWDSTATSCDNTKSVGLPGGCWRPRLDISTNDQAGINATSLAAADTLSNEAQLANTFGEAAIDLQAANIFSAGTCKHFGSAMLASRSSTSVDATMKDYAGPAPVDITNCGTVNFTKTGPNGPLNGTNFAITQGAGGTTAYQPTTTVKTAAAAAAYIDVNDAGAFPSVGQFPIKIGTTTTVVTRSANRLTPVSGTITGALNATVTWTATGITWPDGVTGMPADTATCSPFSSNPTGTPPVAARCTFTDLPNGSYTVREISAPLGYTLDPAAHVETITDSDKGTPFSFSDGFAPATLTFTKKDDANNPIAQCGATVVEPCAQFKVYTDVAPTSTASADFHDAALALGTTTNTSLTAAVTDLTATSVTVLDATKLVSSTLPFWIKVDSEEMKVTAVTLNVLTVVRGARSTAAGTHSNGAGVTQLGEDTVFDTCVVIAGATNVGKCSIGGINPGAYWLVETHVPDGYTANSSLPYHFTYTLGGSATITVLDSAVSNARQFKVVTVVCRVSDGKLYGSRIAYDPSPSATPTALTPDTTAANAAAIEAAVCGLTGDPVHVGGTGSHSAVVAIPTAAATPPPPATP